MSDMSATLTMPAPPQTSAGSEFRIRHHGPLRLQGEAMSDDEFYQLCLDNRDLRIERTANHQIIIMPPTGSETGNYNFEISAEVAIWNRQHRLGNFHRLQIAQRRRTLPGYFLDS